MKLKNAAHDAANLLTMGPIDLVGRGAEAILANGYSPLELERAGLTIERWVTDAAGSYALVLASLSSEPERA